jgi:hypothetical protein
MAAVISAGKSSGRLAWSSGAIYLAVLLVIGVPYSSSIWGRKAAVGSERRRQGDDSQVINRGSFFV